MRAVIFLSTVCLTANAAMVTAQQPTAPPPPPKAKPVAAQPAHHAANLKPSAIAGVWSFENTVKNTAGQDTVVSSELSISANAKTWVTHLAGRDPVPTRVVKMAGDSAVTESGPFPSVARAGQTVTTRETFHFKGDQAWGTIEAKYSNGEVVKGTIKGMRKK
jgi:hypothetical protein